MIRLRHKLFLQALVIFDQVVLIGVFLGLVILDDRERFAVIPELLGKSYQAKEGLAIVLTLFGWFFVFTRFVRYDANRFTTLSNQLLEVVKATSLTSALLLFGGAVFDVSVVTVPVLASFWICTTVILMTSRFVVRLALMALRQSGRNCRHLVIVGGGENSVEIAERVEARRELGYQIGGFFLDDSGQSDAEGKIAGRWKILGTVGELRKFLERGIVDEVMVCLSIKEQFARVYETIEMCKDLGIVVRLVPDLPDVKVLTRSQVEDFDGAYVVTLFRENLLGQLLLKRLMDFAISLVALIVLTPLFIVVALLITLTSPGPVFFRQERVGMNKRRFNMLKFRSMVVGAEARKAELSEHNEMDGPVFKMKNDPRVTKVGAIIRKYSIDELPQLINVLKGDMSLVGPRPPLWSEVDDYDWSDRKRLSIKPGITCLWQVSGRNSLTFEEWMELDREYIDNWSVWLDLKILFMTIPVVLRGHGAS